LLPQPYLVWKLKHAIINESDQKYVCLSLFRIDKTPSSFVLAEHSAHHHRLLFTSPAPTVGTGMLQLTTSRSYSASHTLWKLQPTSWLLNIGHILHILVQVTSFAKAREICLTALFQNAFSTCTQVQNVPISLILGTAIWIF